jgi:hypothetical protein
MAEKSEMEQRKLNEHLDTARRLVTTCRRRKAEMYLWTLRKPLPNNEKLIILRSEFQRLAIGVPLSRADAEEMVTWDTAQALQEMKEQIDEESLELLSLYEQLLNADTDFLQEVCEKLEEVESYGQEYRRVQSTFMQELAVWRKTHAIIARVWEVVAKIHPAKEAMLSMEVPHAADWIYWTVGQSSYKNNPDNALAVEHIASTEVAGEAWRSEHENDEEKMKVYNKRLAQRVFAQKLWEAVRKRREKESLVSLSGLSRGSRWCWGAGLLMEGRQCGLGRPPSRDSNIVSVKRC